MNAGTDGETRTLAKNDIIYGVFAFLDAASHDATQTILPDTPVEEGAHDDVHPKFHLPAPVINKKGMLRSFISGVFRLKDWDSLICERLAAFQLYYHEDMADALATAYMLHRAAQDPLPAFHRSYVPDWAILSLMEEYEWRNPRGPHSGLLEQIRWHSKPGDKMVRYTTGGEQGLMLIRGLHRVVQVTGVIIDRFSPDTEWMAAKRKFDEMGGARGLLEGRFIWPPVQ